MRIIEKIEIKHFRSFDGGVGQPKVEILDIKDLNIFSGANDSGKSNILRALNLFFNDEIAPGIPFNLSRDLSKVLKDRSDLTFGNKQKNKLEARQRDLLVKIKIHFCNEKKDGILKEKFWVEKTWDKSGLKQPYVSNAGKDDRDQHRAKAQLTLFLDKIQFEYIPAVKDRDYFSLLFKKLQDHLFEIQEDFERKNKKKFKKLQSEVTALTNEELDVDTAATVKLTGGSNKFKMQSEKLNELLKQETQSLFEEFKSSTNIDAKFNVPDTLVDFFRTLRVDTGNDVSLFDRGDGVQARFIPTILNEISRDTNQKTIWGFEEPENSYEPLRCFELAQDFLKYSKAKQIFVTSHAFPFIALKDENISSYRVRNKNSVAQVGTIDWKQRSIQGLDSENNSDELEKEVGILETYSKLSEHLGKEILKQKYHVFIEDSKKELYKIAWLKLRGLDFNKDNFEGRFQQESDFSIISKNGKDELQKHLDQSVVEEFKENKIIGIFDFDDAFNNFNGLHADRWGQQEGSERSCLLRKRNDHACFYSILIPVPMSRDKYAKRSFQHNHLILEHLFEDDTLDRIGVLGTPDEPSGGQKITKINGRKNLWKKVVDLPKEDFKNFSPLFEKIDGLFGQ